MDDFEKANVAVDRTARKISAEIEELFNRDFGEQVALDYVQEALLRELTDVLLNLVVDKRYTPGIPRPATLRLSNALHDYRDSWRER
jgi:hypothetical protein